MKKSLLMTIIMTLVLVVAMSTATYAWYTSNSTVNVSETTVNTATSNSSNLGIGDSATIKSTSYTLPENATKLAPMVPNLKDGSLTLETPFSSARVTAGTPSKWANAKNSETPAAFAEFYVNNFNVSNAVDVKPTFTINDTVKINEEDQSLGLCVAMFYSTDDGTTYTLLGIFRNGTSISYVDADIVDGNESTTKTLTDKVYNTTAAAPDFQIAANSSAKIALIAWFDGVELVDNEAGNNATFSIAFNGTLVEVPPTPAA